MGGRVDVRPAVMGDAETIAGIHVTAWQQTYRHLVDPARLDALDPADRVERWREIIRDSAEDVWVAQLDGEAVAWAAASDRDPLTHPRSRELNGIYALARAHGSGVGQALLDASMGIVGAFLWVAANNPRAHSFYGRNGFVADGARDEHRMVGSPIEVIRFVR